MKIKRRDKLWLLPICCAMAGCRLEAATLSPVVASWLAAQTNMQTWEADFVQTRQLKSLAQPLTATGHLWFEVPNRFRWVLGHPPETIAVRAPEALVLIYPRLKRVERYPLIGGQTGRWRDALALLDAGFPRSQGQLLAQYDIVSQTVKDQACKLVLEPKSASARRMMPRLEIDFGTRDFLLRGTELHFADGSSLRNDFKNPVLNPKLDKMLFTPEIPPDYKHIEPLKGGRWPQARSGHGILNPPGPEPPPCLSVIPVSPRWTPG
jgi:outer membrane lipoprotein-sorting protein